MAKSKALVKVGKIQQRILLIRGEKIIIDADLAEACGVSTKALNQAIRRPNRKPCPGKIHAGFLAEEPTCIGWHCPSCGDNGLIGGWEETRWNRTSQ